MNGSSIEMTVDKNMNVDNEKKNNVNKSNTDLESGSGGVESDTAAWGRLVIIVLALAVLVAACAIAWVFQDWQTSLQVLAILVMVYVIAFYYRWIYVAIRTAPRDLKALYCYVQVLLLSKKYGRKNWAVPDIFHDVVKRNPKKACFLFEDETWTFQQVEDYSLRVSAVLKNLGVKVGDVVGVMIGNCPEMPATWLGVARLGGVSPLINTNQTGSALLHSINVAKCNYVIYSAEYESAIRDISKELSPSIKIYKFTRRPLNVDSNSVKTSNGPDDFTHLLETTAPMPWKLSDGEGFSSKLTYIYTSGTTGLPKAAVITSARMVFMSGAIFKLGGLNNKDVMYCPMPLYHSAGGVVTMGMAIIFGSTVALRAKFSASQYFKDCIKYNATAAHYIGEMCRYVLATPPAPTDTQHKVRIIYGNGMRVAIWRDFVKRFNIKRVSEFYGATEGNANIVNVDNKEGAIGFISRIIPAVYPVTIIKVDEVTGEPIRNKKGLCMLAEPNIPGVCIGKINQKNPARAFLGYVDKAATEKKVVFDVFSRGDSAFISGDILVADEFGYLYFKDRTGDTFRWRGENVSTTEVEAAISKFADQRDAVVYGVEIPNTDGRAGMCGIVDTEGTLNIEQLGKAIEKDLPKYARPIFFRVMTTIDMTGTFKMKKGDLQKDGYDPNKIKDKLFYLDPKLGVYLPLGPEEYEKVITGQIRL